MGWEPYQAEQAEKVFCDSDKAMTLLLDGHCRTQAFKDAKNFMKQVRKASAKRPRSVHEEYTKRSRSVHIDIVLFNTKRYAKDRTTNITKLDERSPSWYKHYVAMLPTIAPPRSQFMDRFIFMLSVLVDSVVEEN